MQLPETIRGLAVLDPRRRQLLERLLHRRGLDLPLPIPERPDREAAAPLSHGQLGLWLADQVRPDRAAYNMPAAAWLEGPLDVGLLSAALSRVVARHDSLRTGLRLIDGRPRQSIELPRAVPIRCWDLAGVPAERRQAEALCRAAAFVGQPFRLDRPPLLRVGLARLAERRHLLVVATHHAVGDAWSTDVLLREWADRYGALSRGEDAPPAEPPVQYAAFAEWQRRQVEEGRLDKHVEYWRRRLEGAPTLLDLPADRRRPATPSGRGGLYQRSLPSALAEGVEAQPASRFATLLAGLALLLFRYTGRRRLVVGTPVAGRDRAELAGAVGYYVNALPLVVEVEGERGFAHLLSRVREETGRDFAHQAVPFDHLVEVLRPQRDPCVPPVFQVMFALREEREPGTFGDLQLTPVELRTGSALVDLTVIATRGAGGVSLAWEYARDLFDERRIAEMARHFAHLLAAALAEPETPLARLPMLSAGERQRVLDGGRAAPVAVGGGTTLHGRFLAAAAAYPQAVAVAWRGGRMTYAELERQAAAVARALAALGVGRRDRVGVLLPPGPQAVTALLGVLGAGAVFAPLDGDSPQERLDRIAARAGLRAAVTVAAWRPRLGAATEAVLLLDEGGAEGAGWPQSACGPADPAYLVHTSGSTGQPRGVEVSHGAAAVHMEIWRQAWDLGPDDRVCQFASLAVDAWLEQTLPALFGGACLVARDADLPAAETFCDWVEEQALTVLYLPVAYWGRVTRVWERRPRPPSVRLVNAGGDTMDGAAARRFRRAFPPSVLLVNGYGPTEAVVTASTHAVAGEVADGVVPIGRPLPGRRLYVLDRGGELVPEGIPGELAIGGPLLALGYAGDARRTAERFTPDPFAAEPGGRLYLTGDLARRRRDGVTDFLGRVDRQVKVRGFRVEPGEVEGVLQSLPGVEEAAVVARSTEIGERRLIAFVTGGAAADAEALRRRMAQLLPPAMVPAAVVGIPKMPRTAGGKIDRRALPEARFGGSDAVRASAPRDALEALLARLWAEALEVPEVGVEESFFALGGDSIISLEIISRAHQAGVQLTPAQFFRHPTVAGLARAARAAEAAPAPRRGVAAAGPLPLMPLQHWFFEQELARPEHWNQAAVAELGRRLEGPVWVRAFGALAQRHPALRQRFVRGEEGWRQEPQPAAAAPAGEVDLRALPEAAAVRATAAVAAQLQGGLGLADGPLLRGALVRRGDAPDRLLVVVHHLVMDGISWRVLLEDLQRVYEALAAGSPPLPPPRDAYGEWARALAAAAARPAVREELPHWLAAAAPAESPFPADFPAAEATVADAEAVVVELDAATTRELQLRTAAFYRVRFEELLLAGLALALERHSGRRVLPIELERHGRDALADVDVSRAVGWFAAKFPVRFDLTGLADTGDPAELLPAVKEQLRRVPGRGAGHGLLRYLAPEDEEVRALRELPSPAVHFNFLGRLGSQGGGWPVRFLPDAAGPEVARENRLPQELEVVAMLVDGRLRTRWTFGGKRHLRRRGEELAAGFVAAVEGFATHARTGQRPRPVLSDLPLAALTPAQLERIAARYPGLEDAYPLSPVQHGMLFHSLYEPRSGVYVEQLACELAGPLDAGALQRAWQRVVDRHGALRTAFVWDELAEPVQVVVDRVALPFTPLGWTDLEAAEREARLADLLAEERRRGFDLARPPLMRLHLVRIGPLRHRLVWTVHHLLLDGWSEPHVLGEVFRSYAAELREEELELPEVPAYREYIAWVGEQDVTAARQHWRRALSGLRRPTPMPADPAADAGSEEYREEELHLSRERSMALRQAAREAGVTISTLLAAAWAVLVGHAAGEPEAVFGLTVSGRPAALPGCDRMVGTFINTLPLRVPLPPAAPLLDWLRDLQERLATALEYDFSSLVEVQGASEVPRGTPLFDTLLVVMNQPRRYEHLTRDLADLGLVVESVRSSEQTNYPLTLTAIEGDHLTLQLNHRLDTFGPAAVTRLLADLDLILARLVEVPGATVGDLLAALVAVRQERRGAEAGHLRERRRAIYERVRRGRGSRQIRVAQGGGVE